MVCVCVCQARTARSAAASAVRALRAGRRAEFLQPRGCARPRREHGAATLPRRDADEEVAGRTRRIHLEGDLRCVGQRWLGTSDLSRLLSWRGCGGSGPRDGRDAGRTRGGYPSHGALQPLARRLPSGRAARRHGPPRRLLALAKQRARHRLVARSRLGRSAKRRTKPPAPPARWPVE